jgi:hypothetical protein
MPCCSVLAEAAVTMLALNRPPGGGLETGYGLDCRLRQLPGSRELWLRSSRCALTCSRVAPISRPWLMAILTVVAGRIPTTC